MSKEKKIKRMQQQQAMQGAATPNSVLDAVKSNHQNQAQEIKTENKEEKMVSQHIEHDASKKTESDMLISHNNAVNAAQNDAKIGAIDDTVKEEILPETRNSFDGYDMSEGDKHFTSEYVSDNDTVSLSDLADEDEDESNGKKNKKGKNNKNAKASKNTSKKKTTKKKTKEA